MPAPAGEERAEPLGQVARRRRARSSPSTGDGASQSRVPRTRSVNTAATCRCRSAGRSDSAIGQHRVELGVALVDADLHAAGSHASRLSKLSTATGCAAGCGRLPRSSNHSVSSATPSGSPSKVNVCTIRSGRTSWKQPRKRVLRAVARGDVPPAAAGAGVPVLDRAVPVRSGPTHCANSSGSVCARNSCSGVAAKSRVMPDDRHLRVGLDRRFGEGGHDAVPSCVLSVSFMAPSTASSRR